MSQSERHRYWIGVVSREHALRGVAGSFIQLNHGKKAPLERLRENDLVAIYSPSTSYPGGEPLQKFTALGVVATGEIYQVRMSSDFEPYRVDVVFLKSADASIKPLINRLSFIKNKTHWGGAFRFGYIRVPRVDFEIIAAAMEVDSELSGHAL